MICNHCGKILENGNRFCRYCGVKLVQEQEDTPAAEKAAPAVSPLVQPEPQTTYRPHYGTETEKDTVLPERTMGAPVIQLPTRRSLVKMIFLGLLTLGIYNLVIWCKISGEINIAASRHDGKRTVHYLAVSPLAGLTLGIYYFVWHHGLCKRLGEELGRRNLGYKFGPSSFWLWNVLGSLILVGPFIFLHKLMKATNKVNQDFNLHG